MTFSTRISIQWPPQPALEETKTYVITSPGDHFVDIRAYKSPTGPGFNDLFQWCITGKEVPIEGTNKIKFVHEVDSMVVVNGAEAGDPDVGDFSPIEGSEDRKEVGEMVNPQTGRVQPYVEIWRSLCPIKSTPSKEVREDTKEIIPVKVWGVTSERFCGKYIEYGNWSQGVLHDIETNQLHVVRGFYDGKWKNELEYGNPSLFPIGSEEPQIGWTCLERR